MFVLLSRTESIGRSRERVEIQIGHLMERIAFRCVTSKPKSQLKLKSANLEQTDGANRRVKNQRRDADVDA
jgi:hypothetical protein